MADEFDTIEQDAKVEEERSDEAYQLDRKAVSAILYAVDIEDQAKLIELMEPLHPADIADLLEQINAYDRSRLIRLYDREFDGDILSELDESIRDEVIAVLTPQVLTQAVRDLDSDDVVDLVEDMDDSQQEAILDALEDADRLAVKQALSYPEFSAGRLMQREVVMAPEHWTVGDAIDHLRSSSEEDLPDQFYHIVVVDPRLHPVGNVTLGKVMRSRRDVPLLDINLLTSIAASLVIAQFEVAIAQIVALAVLMPIVASMGGNAGTQSLTVAVRAIATKDLTGSNVWRVIRREVLVGLFNGLLFAVVMGVVGLIWFGSPALGYVIAAAMVVNMVVAGFAGTVIPVILDRVGVDPALASGSFVTTVTDVVGFFSFLGLAAAVLL